MYAALNRFRIICEAVQGSRKISIQMMRKNSVSDILNSFDQDEIEALNNKKDDISTKKLV